MGQGRGRGGEGCNREGQGRGMGMQRLREKKIYSLSFYFLKFCMEIIKGFTIFYFSSISPSTNLTCYL